MLYEVITFFPTHPHRISPTIPARYMRLLWYQWLTPAPMMIEQRPSVFSAVDANSRANWRTVFAS